MSGRKWWQLLLATWFLLYGIFVITNITIMAAQIVMGVLAILVALCCYWDK